MTMLFYNNKWHDYSDFDVWKEKFEKSRSGRKALDALNELEGHGDPDNFQRIKWRILQNCYEATIYRDDKIKGILKRKRTVPDQIPEVLIAIDTILDFYKENPTEAWVPWLVALSKIRPKYSTLDTSDKRINWIRNLDLLLETYAEELKYKRVFPLKRIGAFEYPRPVQNQTNFPDLALSGLLFHLVLLFRDWTHLGIVKTLNAGRKMPNHGRPCYRHAALFINAALNKDLSSDQVKSRLKKLIKNNPKIGIASWHHCQE